jgi:outer membrane receptor for Fe3+-dicitrate
VKAQFVYQTNFGTTFGVNTYLASGIPRTRELAYTTSSAFPIQYLGRNSDGRLDMYSQTDLQVAQDFSLGGAKKIQVLLNVLNLFNQQGATNYFATENASGTAINFDESLFYAKRTPTFSSMKAAQGVPTDPRFLLDSGWQTPIAARIGVKFLF